MSHRHGCPDFPDVCRCAQRPVCNLYELGDCLCEFPNMCRVSREDKQQ